MNISGDYNTTEKELSCVEALFQHYGINFEKIEKNPNANDGDVLVTLSDGRVIGIEVKEESCTRFQKYGDLGIDFISVFHFKRDAIDWKGAPKRPQLLNRFLGDIDKTQPFKYGKLYYSRSDLWLFFVTDENDIKYHAFFDGRAMVSNDMKDYLTNNCLFAVNNKPSWQLSNSDPHNSAVFFINHNDRFLNRFKVDLNTFINN